MPQPTFTQDWTQPLPGNLARLFPLPPREPVKALEIGAFEGRGTRILFQHLIAHHPESRLYCVDPWLDVYVPGKSSIFDPHFVGQYQRFLANTADLGPRVVALRGTSNEVVPGIGERLDFAYIDGDHSPAQVYRDACMVAPLMKKGAVILFDDYPWAIDGLRCGDGVDRWVAENRDRVQVLFVEYQAALRVL